MQRKFGLKGLCKESPVTTANSFHYAGYGPSLVYIYSFAIF